MVVSLQTLARHPRVRPGCGRPPCRRLDVGGSRAGCARPCRKNPRIERSARRLPAETQLTHFTCSGDTVRRCSNRGPTVHTASVDGRATEPVLDSPRAGRIWPGTNRAAELPCVNASAGIDRFPWAYPSGITSHPPRNVKAIPPGLDGRSDVLRQYNARRQDRA